MAANSSPASIDDHVVSAFDAAAGRAEVEGDVPNSFGPRGVPQVRILRG